MANIKTRDSRLDLLPVIRISLGILAFLLGIVGAILPVMQGWIFFLISAALFFPRHRYVHTLLERGEAKVPRFVAWLRRIGVGHHMQPEPAPQRIDPTV